jgi:hypothetical protein
VHLKFVSTQKTHVIGSDYRAARFTCKADSGSNIVFIVGATGTLQLDIEIAVKQCCLLQQPVTRELLFACKLVLAQRACFAGRQGDKPCGGVNC